MPLQPPLMNLAGGLVVLCITRSQRPYSGVAPSVSGSVVPAVSAGGGGLGGDGNGGGGVGGGGLGGGGLGGGGGGGLGGGGL